MAVVLFPGGRRRATSRFPDRRYFSSGRADLVDRIKLTLKRKYRYQGKELSYFNAACPAPSHSQTASFPLATAKFSFAGGEAIAATVNKACRVSQ